MIIELLALLLGVLLLSLAVYHVAQFTTKEMPFEEALAEQRRNKNLEIISSNTDKNQKKMKTNNKKMRPRREDSHSSHGTSRAKVESNPVPVHQPTKTKTRDLPPKDPPSDKVEETVAPQANSKPTTASSQVKNQLTASKAAKSTNAKKESTLNAPQEKPDKKKVETEKREDKKPKKEEKENKGGKKEEVKEEKKPKKEEEKKKKETKEDKRQKEEQEQVHYKQAPKQQQPGQGKSTNQGQGKTKEQEQPKRKLEGGPQGEKKPPKPQAQTPQAVGSAKGGSGTPTASPKKTSQQQPKDTTVPETVKEQMEAVMSTQLLQTTSNNNSSSNFDKKKRKELEDRKNLSLISDDSLSPLLSTIQKTNLSDGEIQLLIETLLNKQQLTGSPGGEWVEKGRVDPMLQLKKQLEESEARLKEQLEAQEALSAKIVDLRADLNTERGRSSSFKKQLDSSTVLLQQKLEAATHVHKEQIAAALKEVKLNLGQEYQTKLIQHQTAARKEGEAQLQETKEALTKAEFQLGEARVQLQEAQAQCQQANSSAAEIETTLQQLQQERDAQLQKATAEREELVTTCQQYQQHLAALKEQSAQQEQQESAVNERLFEVQQKLSSSEAVHSQALIQLKQLASDKELLQQQINNQENLRDVLAQTQVKLKKIGLEKSELESRIVRLEKDLSTQRDFVTNQKSEIERLNEEKDSLASQSVRPAAEGRENGDVHPEGKDPQEDHVLNHQFHSHKTEQLHEEQISALTKEVSRLKEEAMLLSKRCEDAHGDFKKLSQTTKDVLSSIYPELLQAQHLDPVAFLKEAENASATVQTLAVEIKTEIVEKLVEKVVQDPKLLKDFDDIKKQNSELSVKIQELKAANRALEERLSAPPVVIEQKEVSSDDSLLLQQLEEENKSLVDQVANYQDILANTESLLKTLQKSVESEESSWHEKILQKETQIGVLAEDKKNLTVQVEQLQKSLNTVKQAEEAAAQLCDLQFAYNCMEKSLPSILSQMESQLNSLKEKLTKEEETKGLLQEQLNKAQEQLKAVTVAQVSTNGPANGVDSPLCNEDDLSQADSASLVSSEGQSHTDEPDKKKKKKKGFFSKFIRKSTNSEAGSPTITE